MDDIGKLIDCSATRLSDKRAVDAFGTRVTAWLTSELLIPGSDYVRTLIVLNSVVARAEVQLAANAAKPTCLAALSAHHVELAAACRRYHFDALLKEGARDRKNVG